MQQLRRSAAAGREVFRDVSMVRHCNWPQASGFINKGKEKEGLTMGIQINSSQDKIAFTIEVESRLLEATGLHRKKHGTQFSPPEDLLNALKIWRVMAQRYKQDMMAGRALSWHTAEEQSCEQEIAQYLVAKIHELKGVKSEEPYVPRSFN